MSQELSEAARRAGLCLRVPPDLGLSQATASHHPRKLTGAGLLEREQRGKWAYFFASGGLGATGRPHHLPGGRSMSTETYA